MPNLALEDIQGNLLLGYKYPHVAHLFGEVRAGDTNSLAQWRKFIASVPVTRASSWGPEKPMSTLNVGLSYRAIAALYPSLAQEISTKFPAFAEGMPRRSTALGDGPEFEKDVWTARDVWVSLHARTADALAVAEKGLQEVWPGSKEKLQGQAIERNGNWHEHFGFRDDISYPALEGIPGLTEDDIRGRGKLVGNSWQALATGELILGQTNESGRNVLSGLSGDAHRLLANGSFAVFRHLQQHVGAFREYLGRFPSAADAEVVAHGMMGRKLNGDPLVPVPAGSKDGAEQSDFSYKDDPAGAQCPLGSHVRRTNPRSADGRHRIVRRGVPYGRPLEEGAPDENEQGLLFVAFNADIADQFEFVQEVWCNGTLANNVPHARDPIGSALPERSMMIEGDVAVHRFPRPLLDIPRFVTCLGGQYYLYPGLSGLAFLAAAASASNS